MTLEHIFALLFFAFSVGSSVLSVACLSKLDIESSKFCVVMGAVSAFCGIVCLV